MSGPIQVLTQVRLGRGTIQHYDPTVIDGVTLGVIDVASSRGAPAAVPLVAGTEMKNYVRGSDPATARAALSFAKQGVVMPGGVTGINLPSGFRSFSNNFVLTFWFFGSGASNNSFNNTLALIRAGSVNQFALVATANSSGIASQLEVTFPGISIALASAANAMFIAAFDTVNIHQHAYEYRTSLDGTQAQVALYLDGSLIYTSPWQAKTAFTALGSADPAVFGTAAPYVGTLLGRFYRARFDTLSGAPVNPATGAAWTGADIAARDWAANKVRLQALGG